MNGREFCVQPVTACEMHVYLLRATFYADVAIQSLVFLAISETKILKLSQGRIALVHFLPNLVPRLFLSREKDPGWVWSRATQILGGNK